MTEIFELILRAKNGQERRYLQWFPTPASRTALVSRWQQRGLQIVKETPIL